MSRASIERKLRSVSSDLARATAELQVIDEQLLHFADSAEDARLRAMVSERSDAQAEYREAAKTVAALSRDREHWAGRLVELEQRQNDLLDDLLEASE